MQEFLVAGSGVALLAAIIFLFVAVLRAGKVNAIYAYVFFLVSMLILALYMFLWHIEFGRGGQKSQAIAGLVTNADLGQWGQILGGGIVAALLTLGGLWFASWYKRPKIGIKFENGGFCYCRKANDPPDSYWLRVKVTNSGKSVAKSCVGRLVEFADDSEKPIDHDPVRLHWIDTPWQVGTQLFTTIDLHQEQYEFLDVLLTKKDSGCKPFLFTGLQYAQKTVVEQVSDSRNQVSLEETYLIKPVAKLGDTIIIVNEVRAKYEEFPLKTRSILTAVYGDNVKPCYEEYSICWVGNEYTDIRLHRKNGEEVQTMGSKGRKNVKKPKKAQEKKPETQAAGKK